MNVTIKDDQRNLISFVQAISLMRESDRFVHIYTQDAGSVRVYSVGTGRNDPEIAIYTGARSMSIDVARQMSDAIVMALTITDAL